MAPYTERGWHAMLFGCLFSAGLFAQPINDSILGKWCIDDKSAQFDFYRAGNEYRARLIPIARPNMLDTKNPVDSLKGRKLHGATLAYRLSYNAKKNRWEGGRVYNPENGKTYFCTCMLVSGGARLQFRGFLGVSVFGQTRVWTRGACGNNNRKDRIH
jgi:uncharacterized protein (DUF2147 family)